jgi:hypothetical protein
MQLIPAPGKVAGHGAETQVSTGAGDAIRQLL